MIASPSAAIFFVVQILMLLWMVYIRGSVYDTQVGKLSNMFMQYGLSFFYLIYMYLLRTQLDVISCTPTFPPDGNTYTTFVSLTCGGLCKCWDVQNNGLQWQLFPFAIAAFAIYSIGFPVYLYRALMGNQKVILQDMITRAYVTTKKDTTWKFSTNVEVISQRLGRLYSRFHPGNEIPKPPTPFPL